MKYWWKMHDVRWLFFLLSIIVGMATTNDIVPNSTVTESDYMTSVTTTATSSINVTSMPTPSSEDERSFVDDNLGLIIGVPTGLGLSIFGFIICFIYCGVSALYQNYRDSRDTRHHSGTTDYARGTATTGVRYTSGGPSNNSSAYQASAFEPSAEPPQTTRENTSTV